MTPLRAVQEEQNRAVVGASGQITQEEGRAFLGRGMRELLGGGNALF